MVLLDSPPTVQTLSLLSPQTWPFPHRHMVRSQSAKPAASSTRTDAVLTWAVCWWTQVLLKATALSVHRTGPNAGSAPSVRGVVTHEAVVSSDEIRQKKKTVRLPTLCCLWRLTSLCYCAHYSFACVKLVLQTKENALKGLHCLCFISVWKCEARKCFKIVYLQHRVSCIQLLFFLLPLALALTICKCPV